MLLYLILHLFIPQGQAAETGPGAEAYFNQGRNYYATKSYAEAVEAFSSAVKLAPEKSAYHHWLGKSYGRLAQNSSLFKAYGLSRRTRDELELAVTLDDKNVEAISDLIEYYEQAPGFLGGGQDKADKLRLQLLQTQNPAPESNFTSSPLSN